VTRQALLSVRRERRFWRTFPREGTMTTVAHGGVPNEALTLAVPSAAERR
jgi:hypothetical protein